MAVFSAYALEEGLMANSFKIGDAVICVDKQHVYAGKLASVRDITDFGHVVVYTVGIQTDNSVITFAARHEKLAAA